MSKKLTALVSLALIACFIFTSCNKRLILVDKSETTTEEESTQSAGGEIAVTDTTAAETTDEYIIDNSPTIDMDGTKYVQISMNTDTVLALYRSAMNDVKNVAPGITKSETLYTDDVVAGNGNSDIANSILNIVASSVLDGSDSNSSQRIIKGDITAVKDEFPLYGQTEGCTVYESGTVVNSAVCYGNDSEYKIVITLNDCLNPGDDSEMTGFMKPVDIDSVKDGISKYLVVLDRSQYQFDMNYTGCEITCTLDKATSRMTSLSMKMVIDVAININISVGFWSSDVVKCTATLTDHTDFTDFNW